MSIFNNIKINNNFYCDYIYGDAKNIKNIEILPGTIKSIEGFDGIKTTVNNVKTNINTTGTISIDSTIFRLSKTSNLNHNLKVKNVYLNDNLTLNNISNEIVINSNLNLNKNKIINLGCPKEKNDLVRNIDIDNYIEKSLKNKFSHIFVNNDEYYLDMNEKYDIKNCSEPTSKNDAVTKKYFDSKIYKIGNGLIKNNSNVISLNVKNDILNISENGIYLNSNYENKNLVYIPKYYGFSLPIKNGIFCLEDSIVNKKRLPILVLKENELLINILNCEKIIHSLLDYSTTKHILTISVKNKTDENYYNNDSNLSFWIDDYQIKSKIYLSRNKKYIFKNNSNFNFYIEQKKNIIIENNGAKNGECITLITTNFDFDIQFYNDIQLNMGGIFTIKDIF